MGDTQLTRINKFLSEAGYCSRRAADKLIDQGRVTINGVVPEMGTKIAPTDEVKVDGNLIFPYNFHYLLLNMPIDFDFNNSVKKNALNLMSSLNTSNLSPIQATVKQFSGLVLISNDTRFNNSISEKFNSFKQLFQIKLKNVISNEDLNSIKNSLDSRNIEIISINFITNGLKNELGLEVRAGRMSSIVNLFEKYNHKVIKGIEASADNSKSSRILIVSIMYKVSQKKLKSSKARFLRLRDSYQANLF